MRFPCRRRKVKPDLEHARSERQQAEERLQHDQEHIIIPLREIRERNHVGETINALIQRRLERGT